mgnify:CR=1 FL=1
MEPLQGLDGGEGAPVDGVDVPDGDGPHDAADAVAEEADGDDAEDDGGGAQGQVVEEVLGGEDLDAGRGVGGRGGGDGADGVLLEGPGPRVDELDDLEPEGETAGAALGSPARFELVPAGEEGRPGVAEEVGDEDDEGPLDGDEGGFELHTEEESDTWPEKKED